MYLGHILMPPISNPEVVFTNFLTTNLTKQSGTEVTTYFTGQRISPISRMVIDSCVMTHRDSSEYLHHTQTQAM